MMAGRSETEVGRLLQDVDRMVTEIEIQKGLRLFAAGNEPDLPGALPKDGRAALEEFLEPTRDGAAEIHVSEDNMEVTADLYPPTGSGVPLSVDAFLLQLEHRRVVQGLLAFEIREAVTDVALNRRPREAVVVARDGWQSRRFPIVLAVQEAHAEQGVVMVRRSPARGLQHAHAVPRGARFLPLLVKLTARHELAPTARFGQRPSQAPPLGGTGGTRSKDAPTDVRRRRAARVPCCRWAWV